MREGIVFINSIPIYNIHLSTRTSRDWVYVEKVAIESVSLNSLHFEKPHDKHFEFCIEM